MTLVFFPVKVCLRMIICTLINTTVIHINDVLTAAPCGPDDPATPFGGPGGPSDLVGLVRRSASGQLYLPVDPILLLYIAQLK